MTISQPFYLGKYPVTQAQWVATMGRNPSRFQAEDHPVENVSWEDVQRFICQLNATLHAKEGGTSYRLPTEAEWEYAARAGASTVYGFGNEARRSNRMPGMQPMRVGNPSVGQRRPNAECTICTATYGSGSGLVWEYPREAAQDPQGPSTGGTGSVEAVAGTVMPPSVGWRIVASLRLVTATAPWGFVCSGAPCNEDVSLQWPSDSRGWERDAADVVVPGRKRF